MLNIWRLKYWPVYGKNQVKTIIKSCVSCFKIFPCPVTYKTGNLPAVRVNKAPVFSRVGIDFCGPFYTKEKLYRNRSKIKAYVAVFVCMVTKAVH